jgi:hypothetical protein
MELSAGHEAREKGAGKSHVGMPASTYLDYFGIEVYEAFGDFPYLVGSATRTTAWRDVDVRLILADDEYERLIGPLTQPHCMNLRWNALCLAFSAFGAHMTGLPVDFQIDQRTEANERYAPVKTQGQLDITNARHPLGHSLWIVRREAAREAA